jgi:hypothetical protein
MADEIFIGRKGWRPNPEASRAFQASLPWASVSEAIGGITTDDGNCLLYHAEMACMGITTPIPSRNQGSIGSCVGHGMATGGDATAAFEIIVKGDAEKWVAQMSSAALYGMSRQIAGQLGNWQGSNGSWAADAMTKMGTLYQLDYPPDLRNYTAQLAGQFQRKGIDGKLKEEAAKHKMGTAAPVRNADDVWTALMNGYAINFCSNVGFQGKRNEKGVIRRSGSWAHSMAGTAALTIDGERYVQIRQSWGDDWTSGPYYPEDAPRGSFNVLLSEAGKMASQGDSYALSDLDGFKRRRSVFDALLGGSLTDPSVKTSVFNRLL